jgi:hypothetical protein
MLLNEFLRCLEDLLGAGDRLLSDTGRDALYALGNRLGALGHARCGAANGFAAGKRELSSS